MLAPAASPEPDVCLVQGASGEQECRDQHAEHQVSQEHGSGGKEQQRLTLHIVPQSQPTPDVVIEDPSRSSFKYSTDDNVAEKGSISSPRPSSIPASPVPSVPTASQSPVSPTSPLLKTPTSSTSLSLLLEPQQQPQQQVSSSSSSTSSPSAVTSPETLVRSFSCVLPRPLPAASTAPSSPGQSQVRFPSPLRNSTYPLVGRTVSSPSMTSASSVSMIPSLSSGSTGSTPSLSNFGLGGESSGGGSLDLPRPILRHHHSHSVVRTSSPLRQQVGFEENAKSPAVPKSAMANATLRARTGRSGAKVAWAQTVHAGMDHTSILDLDLHATNTLRPQRPGMPRSASSRPATFHDRSPSMEHSIRAKPSLRHRPSLNPRALPGNRPGSAPVVGLWAEESEDEPINHPSTAMPGFPAVEFSDLRAPKFSRAGIRSGTVIMPVAAPARRSTSTVRPASTVVIEEPKAEKAKETKSSGIGGLIVRKLSRRSMSTPALKEKAAEHAKTAAAPSGPPVPPMPSGSIRHKRTPALQHSISHEALGPIQREHLPPRASSNAPFPTRGPAPPPQGRPVGPVPPLRPAPLAIRPALGPRSPPPPPDVFRQLPPGFGLPSYGPPPPQRPMPLRQHSAPAPPPIVQGRQPVQVAYGPPRAAQPPPPLRHFRSAPGLRPVPLEPLPELSPTSPPLPISPRSPVSPRYSRTPLSPRQQVQAFGPLPHPPLSPTTLNRPARIPAFDDYDPYPYGYAPSQHTRPPYRSSHSEGETRPRAISASPSRPVESAPALPLTGLPALPAFTEFSMESTLNLVLDAGNDAESNSQFTLPDLPGASDEPRTPTRATAEDLPPQTTPTRQTRCASAGDPDALSVPMGQKLSFSAPPTPNIGGHHSNLPSAPLAEETPAKATDDMQSTPRGSRLPTVAPIFATSAAGRSINRSRSPSSLSLCSETSLASLHSTTSSSRSISSLTSGSSASSAASVDMPDPIAEDEDDVEYTIKVASSSTTPSVDSHETLGGSPRLAMNEPLPSPTQGAIIKSGIRAHAAVAHHVHV